MGQDILSVDDIQRQYDRTVRGILDDATLAEDYKMKMAEMVYSESRDKLLQQVQKEKEKLELKVRAARRVAFAAPKVARDPGVDLIGFRQALDKVAPVTLPAELEDILQSAELTGDEYLSKAAFLRGFELQSSKIVRKYLEFRPEEQEAYDAYTAAAEEYNEWERGQIIFGSGGRLRKPSEYQA